MEEIEFGDFSKVDFRVGEIKEAVKVEESEKLIRMIVDFGVLGEKIVFSGIYHWYKPEDIVGKKTVFVVNVKAKKIMGEESQAMIFAAEDETEDSLSLLLLDRNVKNGSRVY
ncbi:MAG: methionine--tRNA ligase [Patescibacteria group bacterium]|jgi:methionine--tRNA ligase beta chain